MVMRSLLGAPFLLSLSLGAAQAQQRPNPTFPVHLDGGPVVPAAAPLPLAGPATLGTTLTTLPPGPYRIGGIQLPPANPPAPGWRARAFTAAGGMLLGMGLGYFSSQVARSDWQDRSNGDQRLRWAALGGSVGGLVGFAFPLRRAAGTPRRPDPPQGRSILTAEEMLEINPANALEAVRSLRPEWLVERGQHAFNGLQMDDIKVYLNDLQLGGISDLAQVDVRIVESIRFLDAAQATARWGSGHTQGVILVSTHE